eukprot:768733-Hanusia_phi.AAC.1
MDNMYFMQSYRFSFSSSHLTTSSSSSFICPLLPVLSSFDPIPPLLAPCTFSQLFKEMSRSLENSVHAAEELSEQSDEDRARGGDVTKNADETTQRLVDFLQIANKRIFVRKQVHDATEAASFISTRRQVEELEKNIQSAQLEIEVIIQSVSIVETRQGSGGQHEVSWRCHNRSKKEGRGVRCSAAMASKDKSDDKISSTLTLFLAQYPFRHDFRDEGKVSP